MESPDSSKRRIMKYKIYLITNKINSKKYVGQTKLKTASRRWSSHKRDAKYDIGTKFCRAIRKYGPENFELTTLEEFETVQEANIAEEYWIKTLDTTNDIFGYNIKAAAEGKELPQSIKDKISASHKQRYIDHPELRQKASSINKGRKFSEEAKANMSIGHTGIKMPEFTEEHKQKMSDSQKKAWENRERNLDPRPIEVKNKITEGLKSYHSSMSVEEKELRSQKAREKSLAFYAKKKLDLIAPLNPMG